MLNNRQISTKRNFSILAIPWCFYKISRAFYGFSTSTIWQKYHPPALKHRPIFPLVYIYESVNRCGATVSHCNALQRTATHCNALQRTATHCNALQHTATHCNTLQYTATHCNSINVLPVSRCFQITNKHVLWGHIWEIRSTPPGSRGAYANTCIICSVWECAEACCSVLQRAKGCCSMLQCAVVCCRML